MRLLKESGEVLGVLGIATDITDEIIAKKLEKEHEVQSQLIAILKAISISISHDLKMPLAGILMTAERLKNFCHTVPLELQDELSQLIKQIETNAQKTNNFIRMHLNNLHRDTFEMNNLRIINIQEFVTLSLEDYVFYSEEKQLVQVDCSADFQVCIDPELFKIMIWNLMKNALFAIKEHNQGHIKIWSTLCETGMLNQLHFMDTAIGISPDQKEKIFDQFYTNKQGGTGLGLFFCKSLRDCKLLT